MTEKETIHAISGLFPKSPQQKNALFTCDAELVSMDGQLYALSMDEFSHAEDGLNDADLYTLGANLAVATLSDALAAGSSPCFFMHAIVEPYGYENFGYGLAQGVREVLQTADCFLLGGDMGKSNHWRYTGVVMGKCLTPSGLTRILPRQDQTLWVTGSLGDGNLCALIPHANTRFELRLQETKKMVGIATACIDTSGGLIESVLQLQNVNPGLSFHIESCALPLDAQVRAWAKKSGMPAAGFAFGGAGEYELLFTTAPGLSLDFATAIGTVRPDEQGGVFWDQHKLPDSLPDPRSYTDRQEYINQLLKVVRPCLQ